MGGVAIGTHGRNHQAALQQAFAMRAFAVAFDDLVLLAGVSDRGFVAFAVTLCTQVRNVAGKCFGARILPAKDSVRPVAFSASWRVGIVPGQQFAVGA